MQERRYRLAVWAMVGAYVLVMGAVVLIRYARYNATAFDLAIQDQVIWNSSQGRWFRLSIETGHYLGDHVSVLQLVYVPLYWIAADVRWLLVGQTITLALGALPASALARRILGRPAWGVVFAAVYLLYPSIGFVNVFDFHPVTMSVPLLLAALNDIEGDRPRRASFFLLLSVLCKEHIGFVAAGIGLYWAWRKGQRRIGAAWMVGGVLWSLVAMFVIIPAFRGTESDTLARYRWLFDGDIAGFLFDPAMLVRLRTLIWFLVPLAGLPLLSPETLWLVLPNLGLQFLSQYTPQYGPYHQYVSATVPFLVFAAIYGMRRALDRGLGRRVMRILVRRGPLRPNANATTLGGILLLLSALWWLVENPIWSGPRPPFPPLYTFQADAAAVELDRAGALIPPDACVMAANNILPHFAHRRELSLPDLNPETPCEYVLIDLGDSRFVASEDLLCAKLRGDFGVFHYEAPVVLLLHGHDAELPPTLESLCD